MGEQKILRASSLPLGARCRAAISTIAEVELADEIPHEISSEPSVLGRAYHWVAESMDANPQAAIVEHVENAVSKFKVSHDDLSKLLRMQHPHPHMGKPTWTVCEHRVEQALTHGGVLRGHLDLGKYWEPHAFLEVHDWKTGWLADLEEDDAPYNDQLKAYAAVFAAQLRQSGTKVERVRGQLDKVRNFDPEPDAFEWTGKQIEEEWVKICMLADDILVQTRLDPIDREYRVGPWCRHNHCRRNCKAYKAEMTTALSTFDVLEVTTENAGPLYERLQLLRKVTKGIDQAIRETVEIMGGLEYAELGKVLELRPQLRKPNVSPALMEKALWDTLNANVGNVPVENRAQFVDQVLQTLEEREKIQVFRLGLYKKPKELKAKN
jgi:hypothetical protein